MLTLARELKWSHFLKSLDVWLQQAPERDSAFARRGHRNTFENSFGKDATTITAQAKGVAFWKVGARLRRPTEGVAKATLRSCTGRSVRCGSDKYNLKTYQKHRQKPPRNELFEASGRICGRTLFLANHNQGPKTVAPPFGSLRRGTCGTGRRLFWRRFFEHFLGRRFAARRAF